MTHELPIAGQPPRERADAARNRARVLAAAAELHAKHGVDGLTLDAVARAAGVGKGTVVRRFGDKSGLVVALLDARERELQDAMLFGPPPLGPGAPPKERVLAFLDAYLRYLAENLELSTLSETASPGARYRIGVYRFWHQHLRLLCAGKPDPDHLAHALLATLAGELNTALVDAGYDWDRIRAGVRDLAERALS